MTTLHAHGLSKSFRGRRVESLSVRRRYGEAEDNQEHGDHD